ncbi:hypothetical protein GCM10007932_27460 [Vibrio penaeicida]|uniref:Uncharacterized protein n=1 Tax=Vibrio penaeicida TaxID=104609 RepID=A0AAV5NRW8_9VIBR|nr:hypothetical protein GCM10007932_27460 [Vibrio penaeicida]
MRLSVLILVGFSVLIRESCRDYKTGMSSLLYDIKKAVLSTASFLRRRKITG